MNLIVGTAKIFRTGRSQAVRLLKAYGLKLENWVGAE
jgi:virulence-associated protein VagC